MRASIIFSTSSVLSRHIVFHFAHLADIHLVLLAEGQLFCQITHSALLGPLPGLVLHNTCLVSGHDSGPFLELKASSIKFEHFHYNIWAAQTRILQVAILLAVQVDWIKWLHVV